MLELNDVLLKGEKSTLSMMAHEGQLTCLTHRGADLRSTPLRWLYAMLGFEPVMAGFISIDGEPLTPRTVLSLRRLMAFVPSSLEDVGQITVYDAPTPDDVFALKANRHQSPQNIDAEALQREIQLTGATGLKARLLAVAVLLNRPILLIDRPVASSIPYLRRQATAGRTVIMASNDSAVVSQCDNTIEINED